MEVAISSNEFKKVRFSPLLYTLLSLFFPFSHGGSLSKKWRIFARKKKRAAEFRRVFTTLKGDLIALSQEGIIPSSSPARLFVAAYEELRLWATLDRERVCIVADRPVVPALERTLDRSIEIEKERWERGTTMLATIASAAPLLGLLGTVWGIFLSFQQMGMEANASLRTVAPGISEALLTTIVGLVVAIPAVFAYNALVRSIRVIENHLESFAYEIINRFDRQIIVNPAPTKPAARPVPKRKINAAS